MEKVCCALDKPGYRNIRKRVISNRQFRLSTLHAEVMARLKLGKPAAVERALVIGKNHEIGPAHFALGLHTETSGMGRSLDEVERAHIERIIRECGGNLSQASRVLDIDRTTLYHKLKRYKSIEAGAEAQA